MQTLVNHGLLGFCNDDYVRSGRITEALEAAMQALNRRVQPTGPCVPDAAKADLLQMSAQLMLLLDRPDDALELFEQCMKHVPMAEKGNRQARSCLIAGLQCLERNQTRTAWNCLRRTLDIKGASRPVQVESCAAMATLFFSLGMRRPAETALRHSLSLLDDNDPSHAAPRAILRVVQTEFLVLDLLRQHTQLNDLAFWPRHDEAARDQGGLPKALAKVAACRAEVEQYQLLTARLDFLTLLLQIAYGGVQGTEKALAHLDRMNSLGLSAYVYAARHELALACIAAGQGEWLRRVMQCYASTSRAQAAQQYNFEHDYCLAKLGELSGRDDAYITHYRQYATQALVQVRRACAYISVPSQFRNSAAEIVRDEVASRLPSRYRRAYQFILANLQQRDLSVRQVAESINVTERALQLAFREHVGMSPSAVIRQCRMERIRSELSEGAAIHGATTLDVARRWGVGSRSALSSGYQEAFGESPRETDFEPL
jgi:AraC-like DNA-binding protein